MMFAAQQLQLRNRLYRRLLSTRRQQEPDAFLTEVLRLFVGISGACQGYLEFRDCHGNTVWASQSFRADEIENISNTISSGIIAEALKMGLPVKTFSALSDPRFQNRESVRNARIKAVLCVPIKSEHFRGVIYLQGDSGFKVNAKENIRDAGLIAEHIPNETRGSHLNY